MIRRIANALLGSGPWRLAPFATIARDRLSCACGVHRAEDFTGFLFSAPGEPACYRAGTALLDQTPTWETLSDGPRYHDSGLTPAEPRHVFSLADAGVITSDGLVYCRKTRRAVSETVRRWTSPAATHPVFGAMGYPSSHRLPGLTLSLLTLGGQGFYHFLLESIPRLALLRPWLDLADHVLCAGAQGGLHARWLAHAGVPTGKIVWMQGLCHVACDQLLFTSQPMRDQQPTAWTLRSIRESFPQAKPSSSSPRRIWISRRDALFRHFAWEDDLLARLPDIVRVELSGFSPAEQIDLAAGADLIVGPHGAGLSHVLFGRTGARVVELFPHNHRQPIYARLASLAGLEYAWTVTDFTHPTDLDRLAAAIRTFAASGP